MEFSNLNEVLSALLGTTYENDVRQILLGLGDHPEAAIDQEFGKFKLCWHPFGNNASNISTVNLGTKPGRSLTERLTNAIDALLEDRVAPGVATPRSARDAAKQWFGRPVTGPDDGMFKWSFSEHGYDRRIATVLNPSGIESAPTVDVYDDGIGLKPDQFPNTILSLQSGNKIQKWYLIGAFGQGGASTLAFCEFALIVSRHRDEPKNVGFTIVKVLRLSEQYKEDTYAYEVWIGYHAILQENSRKLVNEELEQEVMDRLLEADRTRVAQMQVRQALRSAELMQKVLQSQAVAAE